MYTYRPISLCSLPGCRVPLCLVNLHCPCEFLLSCVYNLGLFIDLVFAWPCFILFVHRSPFAGTLTTAFACGFLYLCFRQLNLSTWPHLWVPNLSSTVLWYRILNEDNHDSKGFQWLYQTCLFFCKSFSGRRNYLSVKQRLQRAASGLWCRVWRVWLTWLRWTMIFTRSEF